MTLRNRIKEHRKVRAGDIVPHEGNYRTHPKAQKDALKALYNEIGFARSLLAYELPDGRLKLIDGHLRQEVTPDEEVDVEILDVTDDEAKKLLLAIDPLSQLAGTDKELLHELQESLDEESEALNQLWAEIQKPPPTPKPPSQMLEPKLAVVVYCESEQAQIALWRKLKQAGHQKLEMKTF